MTLSAEVAEAEALITNALELADCYSKCDCMSREMEAMVFLADEVRRLHARVRELEDAGTPEYHAECFRHKATRESLDGCVQKVVELRVELAQARTEFIAVVDAEPELPGDMPDAMWLSMRNDKDAVIEAMRIVVRQTKRGIKARLLEKP